MARTPILAGNWKMNLLSQDARALVTGILAGGAGEVGNVEQVICPPVIYLSIVASVLDGTGLKVGAQNLYWQEKGAFTGEVSGPMVREFAEYVIIGHSERRAYFGETDESVSEKLRAAMACDLLPIVCVGETGAERQAGQTHDVLQRQVRGALTDVQLLPSAVIAYEPARAIG